MTSSRAASDSFSFEDLIRIGLLDVGDGYRAKNDELGGDGPIFLRSGHVSDARIDFNGAERFRDVDDTKFRGKIAAPGDVIVTTKGWSTGRVSFATSAMPKFVYSPHLSYWRSLDHSRIYPGFLRQWSRSAECQRQLTSVKMGIDIHPYLSLATQYGLRITLPPIADQRAIAHALGTLDDKIELNRRMNATLEAIASTLFQSWFVDFDPVRAKLDGGRLAVPDDTIGSTFPAAFEDSAIGQVPRGWTVEFVGEVVDCVGGGTPSTSESRYWENGTHHWTTPKDFSSLEAPILLDTDRKVSDAGIAKISSGLLPSGTLLLSSRAPVGYLAIAGMPVAINQGFIALKCGERASNFFMLNWCQANMAEIKRRATGTTFAEISKQNFRPIRMVLPPVELMALFTARVSPLYARITANLRQSRTLASLREALLPRLLNGQVSVATLGNHL